MTNNMRLISTKLSFLLLVFLLLPIFCLANESFPSFPMAFWGNATLNEDFLPVGTIIRAYCNSDLVGEIIITENGVYGYNETTKNKLLVSSCDDDILFKYLLQGTEEDKTGYVEIKYQEGFVSGSTVNKDLNFTNTQSCSISNGQGTQVWDGTNWGDCILVNCDSGYHQSGNSCVVNSSGGGGGGSSSYIPPVTSTITKIGDANGDDKIDKYDFSLMMSNWNKTGTNVCDFNNDGKVDKYDFSLLMSKWGL